MILTLILLAQVPTPLPPRNNKHWEPATPATEIPMVVKPPVTPAVPNYKNATRCFVMNDGKVVCEYK